MIHVFTKPCHLRFFFFLNNVYNRVEKNNESKLNALDNQDDLICKFLRWKSLLSRCTEGCHSNLFM